ncbi:MAG: hypothetical protein EXR99_02150 [Gemmataceae bacterium]|nr:hypothetical protein [Gemmataceae bacterium]
MGQVIPALLRDERTKQRLLRVEIPIIEQYNRDRDKEYKIRVETTRQGLSLNYLLKPGHNDYQVRTDLLEGYPLIPPETRVQTPLDFPCPHLLPGQLVCLWRQGSDRQANRWDPSTFTCIFAVLAAWRWLACYELWKQTGEWPLPEAR